MTRKQTKGQFSEISKTAVNNMQKTEVAKMNTGLKSISRHQPQELIVISIFRDFL